MPVTVTCLVCSRSVVVPPSRTKRKKFCSRGCYATWLSQHQRGAAHPMAGRKHSEESLARMRRIKKAQSLKGPASPSWSGGRFFMRGYVMISISGLSESDAKLARAMTSRGRDYVPEHRLVMARKLKRPLKASETVHHVNGVKNDNRLRNLDLHGSRTHKMKHAELYRELRNLRALAEKCSCGTFRRGG